MTARPESLPTLAKWASSSDIPDPKVLPKIGGWKLLVRPIEIPEVTKGGIYLPDQVKDDQEYLRTVARVLVVGPLAYTRSDMLAGDWYRPWCSVGDYIIYPKFAGGKIKYDGVKLLILNDDEVLATIDDPEKMA